MPLPGPRDKEVDILRSTFRHFSFVQEVRVFGSRANGIARRSSDLGLAISSPEATPVELQICQDLFTDPRELRIYADTPIRRPGSSQLIVLVLRRRPRPRFLTVRSAKA